MTIPDHDNPIDDTRVAHAHSRLPSAEDAARLTGNAQPDGRSRSVAPYLRARVGEELCVGDLALVSDLSEDSVSLALRLPRVRASC